MSGQSCRVQSEANQTTHMRSALEARLTVVSPARQRLVWVALFWGRVG